MVSIYFGEDKTKSMLSTSKRKDFKTKYQLQKYTNKIIFKGHILRLYIR